MSSLFSDQSSFFPPGTSVVKIRVFPFPLEWLHCVTPIKAMAQLYPCWCSHKNSRCLEIDTDPPLQSRALHTQSFKEIQPISHVLTVLLPSHTWMCFISQKGNKRWSELKLKLWMLWLSLSYPGIISIILLSTSKDLPLIEANKQIKKSEKVI